MIVISHPIREGDEMPKPYQLKKIERDRGALEKVIPELLNKYNGQQNQVARELGVSGSTVSTWLRVNGYRRIVRWERVS